jgi:uncharacterized cysteine cluster protein YcgN (CxxCxxCC family)
MTETPFWKQKSLEEMNREEWESICDGCGKCCLFRLQGEDGQYYTTNVVCRLFDENTCRCKNYTQRQDLVPSCLVLNAKLVRKLDWMPATCAYRLLAQGKDLPWWHYLVSGSRETVHKVGISVHGRVEHELEIDMNDLEDHVVDWFDQNWLIS